MSSRNFLMTGAAAMRRIVLAASLVPGLLVAVPAQAEDESVTYPYERRQEAYESLTPEQKDAYKERATEAARQKHENAVQRREAAQQQWQSLSPEEQDAYKEQAAEAARQKHENAVQRREAAQQQWQSLSPEEQEALKAQRKERFDKRSTFRQGRRTSRGQ